MLTGEPRIARAEIAKHVQKISLTPEGRMYIASGTWNLLGSVAVTMVPGARIELATPAFSGRRSTNELPRLVRNLQATHSEWCQFWCQFVSTNSTNYIGSVARPQLADVPARDGYIAYVLQHIKNIMRSGWLCRVSSVSACQSDHFSWITAHKIS
jgi:hypothetical protein